MNHFFDLLRFDNVYFRGKPILYWLPSKRMSQARFMVETCYLLKAKDFKMFVKMGRDPFYLICIILIMRVIVVNPFYIMVYLNLSFKLALWLRFDI